MHTRFSIKKDFRAIPLQKTRTFHTTPGCGSQAEFYIRPINPCIDDIDMLVTANSYLAFNSRYEIPQGFGDLCDRIICCKLESYEQNLSFVRLRDPIFGFYDWNLEEYTFPNTPIMGVMDRGLSGMSPMVSTGVHEQGTLLSNINGELDELHVFSEFFTPIGPALKCTFSNVGITTDYVFSMLCPNWPLAAEEWPQRSRHSGWPNSATIGKVVREGCDVVAGTHRDMHEDSNQHRLSFSRAEVTLIQSWTRTQQIVYHLLRFFAKREIIRKNCPKEEEVVCTYHLKTLMMWSCEEESTEWWETPSVIAICCQLLGKLCECVKHKRCSNYFIPEANLLGHDMHSEVLQQTIKALDYFNDVTKMSQWFMARYILPVYQEICDEDETMLTEEKVEICRTSACDYNEKHKLDDLDFVILECALRCFLALEHSFNLRWNDTFVYKIAGIEIPMEYFIDMANVSKMHETLADYMKALILFQVSQFILNSELQCDVEILSEIWFHIIEQRFVIDISSSMQSLIAVDKSIMYFNRAEEIMKHLVYGCSENESSFARMVSMLCLHESIGSHDTSSNKTETASRVYLAALFYYSGHLQLAAHLCSEIATAFKENVRFRQGRSLKVNSLLFMDDLATIAGFLLLRRQVLRIRNRNIFLLSPDLFVRYLCVQCNTEILEMHETLRRETSFVADCCLAAVMRYKSLRRFDSNIPKTLIYAKCTEGAEEAAPNCFLPGKMDIGETLARISNEYMIRFYTSLSEEFGAKFNLASCYEALSLYLRRKYENVLTVCTRILQEPEDDSELDEFQFLSVNVCYCFNAYFDEDIQGLVGFQLLVLQLTSMQHN